MGKKQRTVQMSYSKDIKCITEMGLFPHRNIPTERSANLEPQKTLMGLRIFELCMWL